MASNRVYGAGLSVQWGEETEYGTPVAGDQVMFIQSESLKRDVSIEEDGGIVANVGTSGLSVNKVSVGGSLSLLGKPGNAKRLLKHMTGSNPSAVTVVPGVSRYTYTPAPVKSDLYSSTIYSDKDIYVWQYAGMKISKVDFNLSEGKGADISVEFIGMARTTGALTSGLPSHATEKPYKFTESTLALGGETVADIYSVKATYDNGMIAGKNTLGKGIIPQEPDMGERKFTIDIEGALTVSLAEYEAHITSEESVSATLKLIAPKVIVAGYSEQIEIYIPSLRLTAYEDPTGGKDEVVCKLSGQATMTDSGDFLSITLQTASV